MSIARSGKNLKGIKTLACSYDKNFYITNFIGGEDYIKRLIENKLLR